MKISMRDAALVLIGILAGVIIIGVYAYVRLDALTTAYTNEKVALEHEFVALAEKADRIEVIPESSKTVPDCSSRARFEELLSSLPTLARNERGELDLLFASCGDYHARLKTFYAERLLAMNNRYSTARTLHDALFAAKTEEEKVANAMNAIAEGERTRAQDLFTLVALQRTMNDVYAGRSERTLDDVAKEAGTIEARFMESDRKIDAARAEIAALFKE